MWRSLNVKVICMVCSNHSEHLRSKKLELGLCAGVSFQVCDNHTGAEPRWLEGRLAESATAGGVLASSVQQVYTVSMYNKNNAPVIKATRSLFAHFCIRMLAQRCLAE